MSRMCTLFMFSSIAADSKMPMANAEISKIFRRYSPALIIAMLSVLLLFTMALSYRVFYSMPHAAPAKLNVEVTTADGQPLPTSHVNIISLEDGRYRVELKDIAEASNITISADLLDPQSPRPQVMLLRMAKAMMLPHIYTPKYDREYYPVPANGALKVSLPGPYHLIESDSLVISELGFYQNKAVVEQYLQANSTLLATAGIALKCLAILMCLLVLFVLPKANLKLRYIVSFAFLFALSASMMTLLSMYGGNQAGRDLREAFAGGVLKESMSSNLHYGMSMATNVQKGNGPVIAGGVDWARMPGYAYLLSLAGQANNSLLQAINVIMFQALFNALGLAVFCWAVWKLLPPATVLLISVLIATLPSQVYYTQIESIMPGVSLLLMAACALVCLAHRQRPWQWRQLLLAHISLHLAFAFWFVVRTDILPAWAVVSAVLTVILYKELRTVKVACYLLLPLALFLTIGLSWAWFKYPFIHEFSMTTQSVGASLMIGLWEVPHKFVWTVSDGSYFNWLAQLGIAGKTKSGSDFAVWEVLRFWLTYPGYVFSLVVHQIVLYLNGNAWPGNNFLHLLNFTPGLCKVLWVLLLTSLVIGFNRLQTFMFSSILLFNLPIFFFAYSSSGRFFNTAAIALLIVSLAILCDKGFYQHAKQRLLITSIVAVSLVVGIQCLPRLDSYLQRWDSFRYAAPFLDPNDSTLNIVKTEMS